MKIAGIVAEYNPFHKGHAYQIETLRAMGFDGIVAAMSGNFVQRADTALTDKYARARAAVRGGVDLVLELPLPYAVASAEDFALGGITVLAATGILDAVCCGCESGDAKNRAQYEALCRADKAGLIKECMKEGLSYPAACRAAVTETGCEWSDEPNDVLALAYRKALQKISAHVPLVAIERKGSFHGDETEPFESASSIRRRWRAGEDVSGSVPRGTAEMLADMQASDLSRLERSILAYYRTREPDDLAGCYGMREGISQRLCAANAATMDELFDAAKTKRFPHSALRRAVLCGYLKIPASLPPITYLRVLAFNQRGQEMLRLMKEWASLPAVSSLSPAMEIDPIHSAMVKVQLRGDEYFALTLPSPMPRRQDFLRTAEKIEAENAQF